MQRRSLLHDLIRRLALCAAPLLLVACGGGSNDDTTAPPGGSGPLLVSFLIPNQVAFESGSVLTIPVVLSRTANEPVSVSFEVQGSASGVDYQIQTPSPLVFPAGVVQVELSLILLDDGECEDDELLSLSLFAPQGAGAELGTNTIHELTIDGSLLDLEPNNGPVDALINGSLGDIAPGSGVSVCGTVAEANSTGDSDVFLFIASVDGYVNLVLENESPAADLLLLVTTESGQAFLILQDTFMGGGEQGSFMATAGQNFLVVVQAQDPASAGAPLLADYTLDVFGSATMPVPRLAFSPGLEDLAAQGLGWREVTQLLAAGQVGASTLPGSKLPAENR